MKIKQHKQKYIEKYKSLYILIMSQLIGVKKNEVLTVASYIKILFFFLCLGKKVLGLWPVIFVPYTKRDFYNMGVYDKQIHDLSKVRV